MSNQKKTFVQSFAFLFFVLASLLVCVPTYGQTNATDTTPRSDNPSTPKKDPTDLPLPENPCNKTTEVECIPDTSMARAGSTTIDENGDGNGVKIITRGGRVIGVELVSSSANAVSLIEFPDCNNQTNESSNSLWQTRSGGTTVFLNSKSINNNRGGSVVVGGHALKVCPK